MSSNNGSITTGDGATIAWACQGEGPPMVLVHGITEHLRTWDPIAGLLADDFAVTRIDLRGHGESSRTPPYDLQRLATDLTEVCGALGLSGRC
ncbi:MAG: alpha/beta fold hydrolase [Acidimicrobiales bacterium]